MDNLYLFKGYNSFTKINEINDGLLGEKIFQLLVKQDEISFWKKYYSKCNNINPVTYPEIRYDNNIIINSIECNTYENYIIFKEWKNHKDIILVLISNTPNLITLPFSIKEKNIFYNPKEVSCDRYLRKSDLYTSISSIYNDFDIEGNWLVFLPLKRDCNRLFYTLKKNFQYLRIIMINEETEEKILKNLNYGDKKIIITCLENITIDNVSAIFDSNLQIKKYENSSKNKYNKIDIISEETMKKRLNYLNAKGKKVYFQHTNNFPYHFDLPEMIKFSYDNYYLQHPNLFDDNIYKKGNLEIIKSFDLLDRNKNPKRYDDIKFYNKFFSLKNSYFLYEWEKKFPFFIGLIIVNILEEYTKNFFKEPQNNVFESLLTIFLNFISTFKTFETDKFKFEDFCKLNNINIQFFRGLTKKIETYVRIFLSLKNFELGTYNIENVLSESEKILMKAYYFDIVTISDCKNIVYKDRNDCICYLDRNIMSEDFCYFKNLIAIEKKFNDENKYIIKNYILLFN